MTLEKNFISFQFHVCSSNRKSGGSVGGSPKPVSELYWKTLTSTLYVYRIPRHFSTSWKMLLNLWTFLICQRYSDIQMRHLPGCRPLKLLVPLLLITALSVTSGLHQCCRPSVFFHSWRCLLIADLYKYHCTTSLSVLVDMEVLHILKMVLITVLKVNPKCTFWSFLQ